jgi:2-keto-3-deoxy-L-rhamnonate aldolase RhmA
MGADGVVFPHVRSAEEARTAISFFEGVNVWSPANPEGDIVVMLMLETPEVFAQLEEIANIPGYSALACGIGSLTSALGGDRETAEKLNLEVLAHSQRVGMADIITANTESVALRVNQGFLGLLVYGPTADEIIRLGRAAAGR